MHGRSTGAVVRVKTENHLPPADASRGTCRHVADRRPRTGRSIAAAAQRQRRTSATFHGIFDDGLTPSRLFISLPHLFPPSKKNNPPRKRLEPLLFSTHAHTLHLFLVFSLISFDEPMDPLCYLYESTTIHVSPLGSSVDIIRYLEFQERDGCTTAQAKYTE